MEGGCQLGAQNQAWGRQGGRLLAGKSGITEQSLVGGLDTPAPSTCPAVKEAGREVGREMVSWKRRVDRTGGEGEQASGQPPFHQFTVRIVLTLNAAPPPHRHPHPP